MSDVDRVIEGAMSLSPAARADLAAHLVASLDDTPPDDPIVVAESWKRELEERARRASSGEDPGVDWAQVRSQLTDSA